MEKILGKINLFGAAIVTLLSAVFGRYWYLFMAFLILNAVDYVTGVLKARYTQTENSNKGLKGIVKKVGYWIVIGIAFFVAQAFGNLGDVIGINLGFTILIGWFALGTFIINEIRSILENLVLLDVEVPKWLIKGLEIANDKINHVAEIEGDEADD
jgi:toxin secretion/phage lysis holin